MPVDDGDQIEKAFSDRYVGDVGRPDLVRTRDRQAAQEIRIDLAPRRGLARPRLRTQRLDPHQPPHPLAIDRKAILAQRLGDPLRAEKRPLGEQCVDPPHRLRLVVVGRLTRIDVSAFTL
jgi:hypothetical protein